MYLFTPTEEGGEVKCIFDAGDGMITTADLSYDGKEIVFALRRGGCSLEGFGARVGETQPAIVNDAGATVWATVGTDEAQLHIS